MQAESSMKMEHNDPSIRGYLGIENAKHQQSMLAMMNGNSSNKAMEDANDDLLDPQHFTRSVLEQCRYVNPVVSASKTMLYKGSSIARLVDRNPSYADAFSKTVYAKNANRIPT